MLDSLITSEKIDLIFPAFLKAQAKIENAKKDTENEYFKANYATLSSVLKEVKKALPANDLGYVQFPELETVTTLIIHSSGQFIGCKTPIKASKQDAQAYGSALTYARRYALTALLGMTQEDDDGQEASKPNNERKETPPQIKYAEPEYLASIGRAMTALGPDKIKKIIFDVTGQDSPEKIEIKHKEQISKKIKELTNGK